MYTDPHYHLRQGAAGHIGDDVAGDVNLDNTLSGSTNSSSCERSIS
ncbi:hypothetical protein [Mycolicibacterium llatzerense]|nr:hypothetical protein [Mycolicibacterium llatzerense]